MKYEPFYYEDEMEVAMSNVLANHRKEAEHRVKTLLANTEKTEGGCLVTPTKRGTPRSSSEVISGPFTASFCV